MELDRKPQVKECHDETLREIEKANGDVDMGLGPKVERMCRFMTCSILLFMRFLQLLSLLESLSCSNCFS